MDRIRRACLAWGMEEISRLGVRRPSRVTLRVLMRIAADQRSPVFRPRPSNNAPKCPRNPAMFRFRRRSCIESSSKGRFCRAGARPLGINDQRERTRNSYRCTTSAARNGCVPDRGVIECRRALNADDRWAYRIGMTVVLVSYVPWCRTSKRC